MRAKLKYLLTVPLQKKFADPSPSDLCFLCACPAGSKVRLGAQDTFLSTLGAEYPVLT